MPCFTKNGKKGESVQSAKHKAPDENMLRGMYYILFPTAQKREENKTFILLNEKKQELITPV